MIIQGTKRQIQAPKGRYSIIFPKSMQQSMTSRRGRKNKEENFSIFRRRFFFISEKLNQNRKDNKRGTRHLFSVAHDILMKANIKKPDKKSGRMFQKTHVLRFRKIKSAFIFHEYRKLLDREQALCGLNDTQGEGKQS